MIRVVVADDQALLREGIRLMLEAQSDIAVVGEASDGAGAVERARALRPDVVLMDLRMPGTDGIAATSMLAADPDPPAVLVLSTFDQDSDVHAAFRAGACGYIVKTSSPAHLADAVRAAASGGTPLSDSIARRLADDFGRAPAHTTGTPPPLDGLTAREIDVLRQVTTGATNAEIARALHLGESTVKTHISRILVKLGLRDRTQIIVLGYETGLVRPGDDRT